MSKTSDRAYVYVSHTEDGDIGVWRLERTSGMMFPVGRVAAGKNVMPMALAPDRRHLYAVIRAEPFSVVTFAIDQDTGLLTRVASAPLPDSMAYAAVDPTGRWLLTASYGGSKAAVSPIGASGLAEASTAQVVATGRNAHAIVADRSGRFVYVPTLGGDAVMQFSFDTANGQLAPNTPPLVATGRGDGPRHPVASPDNRFLYVLCELTGQVLQYAIDQATGTLSLVASVATIPPEANLIPGQPRGGTPARDIHRMVWCADIAITPDGRHLYTTERTSSRITQMRIDSATGTPGIVTTCPTADQPRGIRIDRTGAFLVASGERSDHIRISHIDPTTGALMEMARYACGKGANWVEIADPA